MFDYINIANAIIMGATIFSGFYIKKFVKNKKIGNFELKRLLPILILIVGETFSILYGLSTGENIILSICNGLIVSGVSAFGYDIFKSLHKKGIINSED